MKHVAIDGLPQAQRKLSHLAESASRKALTAGIRAGMTPLGKAMRAAINAADASPELKRAARKSIGQRFARPRGGARDERAARVGFAVGKKRGTLLTAHKSRGVGLGVANIHWFVLGTDERKQKSGHETGRIRDVFGDATSQAVASSAAASIDAARRKISQVILKEAQKRAR